MAQMGMFWADILGKMVGIDFLLLPRHIPSKGGTGRPAHGISHKFPYHPTGRPKKNGDKIWTDVFHSSLRSIRFQDKLSISLENIGRNGHFEYN